MKYVFVALFGVLIAWAFTVGMNKEAEAFCHDADEFTFNTYCK